MREVAEALNRIAQAVDRLTTEYTRVAIENRKAAETISERLLNREGTCRKKR